MDGVFWNVTCGLHSVETFSGNWGGSVSILDLTDGQQHAVTGIIHTPTDCFSIKHIPRCSPLVDIASSSSRHRWTSGGSWSPSRSSRILPGWPQLWPPFFLQGQSAATGIYLTQGETSHQPLFVGIKIRKPVRTEKSLKSILTCKNGIINKIYENHSFKFCII